MNGIILTIKLPIAIGISKRMKDMEVNNHISKTPWVATIALSIISATLFPFALLRMVRDVKCHKAKRKRNAQQNHSKDRYAT